MQDWEEISFQEKKRKLIQEAEKDALALQYERIKYCNNLLSLEHVSKDPALVKFVTEGLVDILVGDQEKKEEPKLFADILRKEQKESLLHITERLYLEVKDKCRKVAQRGGASIKLGEAINDSDDMDLLMSQPHQLRDLLTKLQEKDGLVVKEGVTASHTQISWVANEVQLAS